MACSCKQKTNSISTKKVVSKPTSRPLRKSGSRMGQPIMKRIVVKRPL